MGLNQHLQTVSVNLSILADNVFKNLFSHIQITKRFRKHKHFILLAAMKFPMKLVHIFDKKMNQNVLIRFRQVLHKLRPRLLNIFITWKRNHAFIVDFHIQTIFPISVLDKNQVMGGHPRFERKMPLIVVSRRIIILNTV